MIRTMLTNRALVVLAGLAAAATMPGAAVGAGSAERGEAKAVTCAACHGPDGNSSNAEWPSLAGQHAAYIVATLQRYKDRSRENVLMTGQALALSDQDIEDLAAYYSQKTAVRRTADPKLVDAGERLYRGGNKSREVSACIACHGPSGRGNLPAGYPVLAGQHAAYTAAQLRAYADGTRSSDANQVMRNIAASLTEDEIDAVASYIQGLR